MSNEDEMTMAVRHVREGAERVRQQLKRIERLRQARLGTAQAEELLANLQEAFEWHRWHLDQVIQERATGPAVIDSVPVNDDSSASHGFVAATPFPRLTTFREPLAE